MRFLANMLAIAIIALQVSSVLSVNAKSSLREKKLSITCAAAIYNSFLLLLSDRYELNIENIQENFTDVICQEGSDVIVVVFDYMPKNFEDTRLDARVVFILKKSDYSLISTGN